MILSVIVPLLLAFSLLYLGSAAYLMINANGLARLFGRHWPRRAPHGELLADRHGAGSGPSREVIVSSLAVHVLSAVGLVATVIAGIIIAHAG